MKVVVITRAAGRSPVKKTVEGDWLRVGRNASCEIHLPDPRVALEQGMIVNREGLVYLEGEAGSHDITRKSVRSVRLKPGAPLDIGPYRLEAQPAPEGFDGAISVTATGVPHVVADLAARTAHLTLGSLGLTKRWAAWVWGIMVLALFLALPAGRVLDLPWSQQVQRLRVDRLWNPGPVILAHQPVEQRCGVCHEKAFEHVRDQACLECHHSIRQHVGPEMRPAALFDGARCSSCHRDHKGPKATHRDHDRFCVDCHRDIRKKSPSADVGNVSDFATDHPAFRLAIPAEGGGTQRLRQGEGALRHQPNLAFPHAVHLARGGVRSPLQGRMKLECRSCHQPDASERGFERVSMEKHCQECHALQFEPAVTTREVPHGNPALAVTAIEEFYASLALKGTRDSFRKAFGVPGEGLLRRPGAASDSQREEALALATRKARKVSAELFEVRVCKTCHGVSRAGEEWRIAPVQSIRRWMPHARFDHRTHRQTPCADCHDVARSKLATDVAIPTIARCRDCHAGARPAPDKVSSNCLLCHGFHESAHPWDPGFRPRGARLASGTADAR